MKSYEEIVNDIVEIANAHMNVEGSGFFTEAIFNLTEENQDGTEIRYPYVVVVPEDFDGVDFARGVIAGPVSRAFKLLVLDQPSIDDETFVNVYSNMEQIAYDIIIKYNEVYGPQTKHKMKIELNGVRLIDSDYQDRLSGVSLDIDVISPAKGITSCNAPFDDDAITRNNA